MLLPGHVRLTPGPMGSFVLVNMANLVNFGVLSPRNQEVIGGDYVTALGSDQGVHAHVRSLGGSGPRTMLSRSLGTREWSRWSSKRG
jgi:hypothetical protein